AAEPDDSALEPTNTAPSDTTSPASPPTTEPAVTTPVTSDPAVTTPGAPAGAVWTPFELDGCQCSDGSEVTFFRRDADPSKVVLYFEGGGACFSLETCDPNGDPTYSRTASATA